MAASPKMKFKERLGSLTVRVVAFSSFWAIVALIAIATVLSSMFRQATEQGFGNVLSAHMFNLISSVSVGDNGRLTGRPSLGDLRFSVPGSGWYWAVEPVSGIEGTGLRSLSLTETIEPPPQEEFPYDSDFQRYYMTDGIAGELIEVHETEIVMDEDNRVARFRMMGNLSELEADIRAFERQMFLYLALFGAGMIAINVISIVIGLYPLRRVRRALARIRSGQASRLDGKFPPEIKPLADEVNALIASNRRIVDRSRKQVGNLAHSLKTPLAVLTNEAREIGASHGALIAEQSDAMRQQVEHYLQRARMAAQRDSVVFRTEVVPVIERMLRVLAKLNPDKEFSFAKPDEEVIFAGEREDFEELVGNLLENAAKWATGRIEIRVDAKAEKDADRRNFTLAVSDDGPGIADEKSRAALERGQRLDETKPGSGLGLAIVADLVKEYEGRLHLARSSLGGLEAVVTLRRAAD